MQTLLELTPTRSRLRRWPWVVGAVLLLGAAITAAVATYVFWLPCRGSMTQGLVFSTADPDFHIPEICLKQMDAGTPFLFASDHARYPALGAGLAVVGTALSVMAWLVLVLGSRWRRRTRTVAAVPAVLSLGLSLASARAVLLRGGAEDAYPSIWWWLLLEGLALAVLVVVPIWQQEVRGWAVVGVAVTLWGLTAFGFVHGFIDYMLMTTINHWDWDCPPGCGYPTALALAVAAGLSATVAATGRHRRIDGGLADGSD